MQQTVKRQMVKTRGRGGEGGGGEVVCAKDDKMLVFSTTNQGFLSHLEFWRRNLAIFSCQSIV